MEKKKYVYNYNKKCIVCDKPFVTQRYGTKTCSQECVTAKLSRNKKYSEETELEVINLRLEGKSSTEIEEITGMKLPSQTKLFKENNILMTEEQAAAARARRWLDHEPSVDGRKYCSKCGENKLLEEFSVNSSRLSGRVSACKSCDGEFYLENAEKINTRMAIYKINNPEKVKESANRYYSKNKEKIIKNVNAWSENNPEKRKEIASSYSKRNRPIKNAQSALYRATKLKATPKWLSLDQKHEMRRIYENCPKGYHVDHIVPLQGENVCGLHVPWNLQYLTAQENMSKSNKF